MGPIKSPRDDSEIMIWRKAFPGCADQASRARQFIGFLLAEYPQVDDAVEVTGEIFNNAVIYTKSGMPGGQITVEVRRWPGRCATIAISDQGGDSEPLVRDVQPIDFDDLDSLCEGGRGLSIVGQLTACWGWSGDVNGRTVTALFNS